MDSRSFVTMFAILLGILLCCCNYQLVCGQVIDCQKPPQLVDPAMCCQDGGRDENTENCAKRLGILKDGPPPNVPPQPPTIEAATCLAECILKESHYLEEPEELKFDKILSDLQQRFSNDSIYVETMHSSFQKCLPTAKQRMLAFKQMAINGVNVQRGCSPFSGILLGCAYMEYFKNCPAHRWTENPQCALAKQFVTQCGLGA